MITQKGTDHRHNYDQISHVRDWGTAQLSTMLNHNVEPRFIDRIILVRACKCGDSKAFECGSPDDMRALLARIKSQRSDLVADKPGGAVINNRETK